MPEEKSIPSMISPPKFVPKDLIEMLDRELGHLRNIIGSKFKVKITALEDVQPWRASTWERCEAAWETNGREIPI